jgi:DNA-binding LytR/AlgR family response regulator
MMKFLILEDEVAASMRLHRMILSLAPDGNCLAVLRGVDDALQWFADHPEPELDVIFADIQLSDGISLEIFSHLDIPYPVIFTTAFDQYALQVFQVHTMDYLLKPIKMEQLSDALQKLRRFGIRSDAQALQAAAQALPGGQIRQRFVVRSGKTIRIINVADISYFSSENKISYLTTFDGKRYAVDMTMDHLESTLNPVVFHRANRQYIVSLQGIEELISYPRSRLKVALKPPAPEEVIVSTEKTAAFKEWLRGGMS